MFNITLWEINLWKVYLSTYKVEYVFYDINTGVLKYNTTISFIWYKNNRQNQNVIKSRDLWRHYNKDTNMVVTLSFKICV